IEFSKENKKIVVSHLRTWQAEEPKKEDKNESSSVKKINEGLEKTTLGDLEVLATLKEEMEKNEK
ncbi:MAG: 30S ribosomal protein S1, partial [Bacteroidales bacterium]|nr:30S ribosomal protein S1 [Bacteroidales bacterium]